jgi:hypothetical protein
MDIDLAIDPGKGGAVAVVANNKLIEVCKCPDTVAGMANIIRSIALRYDAINAVIEKVHSMPMDGKASSFAFGENYGQWHGILAALNIPTREITPQKWMKLYGAMPKDKAERKKKIRDIAEKAVGSSVTLYAADAVALALVAQKIWKGNI